MTSVLAAGYAAVLLACVAAMAWLYRSQWTWWVPRVGIASWQALGLALGLALIGLPLAVALAPYQAPAGVALVQLATDLRHGTLPPGWGPPHLVALVAGLLIAARLLSVTATCLIRTWRIQRRHRQLLSLVGRPDPVAPGALVLDHPSAAAYCLPGLRPTIVVSAGTLDLLRGDELPAVLCHERSHATERHDLVLLPFTALRQALPPARWLRAVGAAVSASVALLVEMRADDRARREYPDGLVAALRRFAAAGPVTAPAGALGVADHTIGIRVRRLHEPRRLPLFRAAAALVVTLALAAAPAGLFLLGA